MVCFSRMGRIRLNPMIKRVLHPPPLPWHLQFRSQNTVWELQCCCWQRTRNACADRGRGRASHGEISLDVPPDYRGLGWGWLIILQEPLSWKAGVLSLIIPSHCNTKEGQKLNSQFWTVEIRNLKETGIRFFLTVFVNLAASLFVLNGYCAFWIQNLIIFN